MKCDETGKCICKDNIMGDNCDECISDYFGFPECKGNFFSINIFIMV